MSATRAKEDRDEELKFLKQEEQNLLQMINCVDKRLTELEVESMTIKREIRDKNEENRDQAIVPQEDEVMGEEITTEPVGASAASAMEENDLNLDITEGLTVLSRWASSHTSPDEEEEDEED